MRSNFKTIEIFLHRRELLFQQRSRARQSIFKRSRFIFCKHLVQLLRLLSEAIIILLELRLVRVIHFSRFLSLLQYPL